MKFHSLEEAQAALSTYIPAANTLKQNYTLERMQAFMEYLGNPQDKLKVIHIAGTSGKTSTAYFVRGLLQRAGQTTGLTISPHITGLPERIQINGQSIAEPVFLRYLEGFLPEVEKSGIPLTYFELLVAFVYWVFAREKVSYAVIETGIGGLLDCTNVVHRPDKVCVITDLGLDHTEILGETIEEIAAQKAGIIQTSNQVFITRPISAALTVVQQHADQQHAPLQVVDPSPAADCPSLPPFQRRNWATALAAFRFVAERDNLLVPPKTELQHAQAETPPGRLEQYNLADHQLVLDGAHNPQKLQALVEALQAQGVSSAALLLTFIAAPDHKIDAALAVLKPLAAHVIMTEIVVVQELAKQSPPAEVLAERARQAGFPSVEVQQDPHLALAALLKRPETKLLVTGSLYLVSSVRDAVIELEPASV